MTTGAEFLARAAMFPRSGVRSLRAPALRHLLAAIAENLVCGVTADDAADTAAGVGR